MSTLIDLKRERFRRLPVRDETWQLAVVRLPQWVVGEPRPPYRPRVALCWSPSADKLGMGELLEPDASPAATALDAALDLSANREVGFRPARIAVRDPHLAGALEPVLAELGIGLERVERLDAIDAAVGDMRRHFENPKALPSLFTAPELELERVRAFAAAAAEFYRAAPWNHLTDEDVVRVDSPVPDEALRFLTVLGGADITRGVGFFSSEREFERMLSARSPDAVLRRDRLWLFSFDPVQDLPIPDSELWETHDLPLAAADAFPSLVCHRASGRHEPPDAAQLTFVEGLLRALAASTEDDFDSGRWSRRVTTFDGGATVELAIPALLEPGPSTTGDRPPGRPDRRVAERTLLDLQRIMAEKEFKDIEEANTFLAGLVGQPITAEPDPSPVGRAQAMLHEALDLKGRARVRRAREALRLDPDCADAWTLLAEEMPDLVLRTDLYRRAVEVAGRRLGPEPFAEDVGHFWGLLQTRPYMRARLGHAECLWSAGRQDEALEHLKDLLRLDPDDNQGVRDRLVPRLLELRRDEEAAAVLAAHADDSSAFMAFARALLEFRRGGPGHMSGGVLAQAVRGNPHVPKHLLRPEPPRADGVDSYRPGSEEEALIAAALLHRSWRETPGAVDWLRRSRQQAKKARGSARGKGRGGRR